MNEADSNDQVRAVDEGHPEIGYDQVLRMSAEMGHRLDCALEPGYVRSRTESLDNIEAEAQERRVIFDNDTARRLVRRIDAASDYARPAIYLA
jgi:hypothetical protein